MKIKAIKLEGDALNYAVAICKGKANCWGISKLKPYELYKGPAYSSDWQLAGPIMELEKISVFRARPANDYLWQAEDDKYLGAIAYADSAIVAAMRCYVASKLGSVVDIPEFILDQSKDA